MAWISTDATVNPDGLSGADIAAGYGRVMMQRFEVPLDPLGNPGAPAGAGQDGIFGEGSDAAFGSVMPSAATPPQRRCTASRPG